MTRISRRPCDGLIATALRAAGQVRSNRPMTGVQTATIPWLVFSDDWGRHPTSCQHLIRNRPVEQSVTWVNMIGTRRPRLDRATLARGWEKLGQWLRRPADEIGTEPQFDIVSPRIWPGFRWNWERRLNRTILARQLRPLINAMPEPPIAITTMPTAADLIGRLPVERWVYYCVDDFSTWPGIDQRAARVLEERLIDRADRIIVVSDALRERVERRGRKPEMLTHGVDLDFWALPARCNSEPLILFWGLIDRRMDFAFVAGLAESLPAGRIVLVGPDDNADPRLEQLSRVERRPGMPLAELPGLAAQADVLIMPYIDAPVTRAMQPLKLKEYLATGKPVVVRDLPSNREWSDSLDLAGSPTEFADLVLMRLSSGLPSNQANGRRRLARESWSAKAETFSHLVTASI